MDTITREQASEDNLFGIPADAAPRFMRFTVALDNYEPVPREIESGRIVRYTGNTTGEICYKLSRERYAIRDMLHAIYIIDDGKTAVPYFVAAWGDGTPSAVYPEGHEPKVILMPFPVNPDGHTRPDHPDRVIDFMGWMLGPKRAYHLKVSEES